MMHKNHLRPPSFLSCFACHPHLSMCVPQTDYGWSVQLREYGNGEDQFAREVNSPSRELFIGDALTKTIQ